MVAEDSGAITSMLCFEPFDLAISGREAKPRGAYIFGVATSPEHRGRGAATALMDFAHARLSDMGFALSALVPADEELFDFYTKRGYELFTVSRYADLSAEYFIKTAACKLEPITAVELSVLRERYFSSETRGLVRWDTAYLDGMIRYFGLIGGGIAALELCGERGYAAFYPHGDALRVKELGIPQELAEEALAALAWHYRPERLHIWLPKGFSSSFNTSGLPYSMVRWYDKVYREAGVQSHIALALD
jgi:predicted GNAT family acetyltransferase